MAVNLQEVSHTTGKPALNDASWRQWLTARRCASLGVTEIVAALLSTEPQGLVMRAQNCVVCVSVGLVIVCPEPSWVDVLPFAPWNQVTTGAVPIKPTVRETVVPLNAC